MGIIKLTSRHPAEPDPEGWDEMTPEEQKRWITEHHPERAARINDQRKAMAATRQRIKELEANLSPEAKSQWNEMCGRGKTDPQLEEWKRERILISAMMSGEVLPTESWNPRGFSQRLKELDETISEFERMRETERTHSEQLRQIDRLIREQKLREQSLMILHSHCSDQRIVKRIEDVSVAVFSEHQEWMRKKDNRPTLSDTMERIRQTIATYDELLTDLCDGGAL